MLSIILLPTCLAISCIGGNTDAVNPANEASASPPLAQQEALTAIASAPAPDGVEPALWAKLTTELVRVVRENNTGRTTSTPPTGRKNAVADLHVASEEPGTVIRWSHHSTGDYDLNSEVNIADLTPIGVYFGVSAADWNWGEAQVADGDSNGEINLADVTPIGLNYLVRVSSYSVFGSADLDDYPSDPDEENGAGTVDYDPVAFSAGTRADGNSFEFTADVSGALPGTQFWVRPNDGSTDGVCSNSAGATGSGYWWMEGREPTHSSRSLFGGPRTGNIGWSFDIGNHVYGSLVISGDGHIYVPGWDHYLYCITYDGNLEWTYMAADGLWTAPAVARDGTVYVGCRDSNLIAVNPDGSSKWALGLTGQVQAPAIGEDGTIYVATSDHKLYSASPAGTQNWFFDIGGFTDSSPAIGSDGAIYLADDLGQMYCVDPDGTERWTFEAGGEFPKSPSIARDGTVYLCNTNGKVYAVNPDGTEKWNYYVGDALEGGQALGADGAIYFGSDSDFIYCLNPSGTLRWKYNADHASDSTPTIGADGLVYIGAMFGDVYCLNPDGTPHWANSTGTGFKGSGVILPNGTYALCAQSGMLYGFDGAGDGTPAVVDEIWPNDGFSGQAVTFIPEVEGTPLISYSWDFGGGATPNTSSSPQPAVTLGDPGQYTVSLEVENSYGPPSEMTFTLHVYPESPGTAGWVHSFGNYMYDGYSSMAIDTDDSVWVGGFNEPGPAGGGDALIAHYAADGSLLDSWTWGTPKFEMIRDIEIADNGDLVCLGFYIGAVHDEVLLLRFAQDGSIVWQKGWDAGSWSTCNDVEISDDGDVFALGTMSGSGDYDIVGLRWNTEGTFLGGLQIDLADEYGYGIEVDGTDFYIAGSVRGFGQGERDVLIMKIPLDDPIEWAKAFGTAENENAVGITLDGSGGIYLCGSNGVMCSFMTDGTFNWSRRYAIGDRPYFSSLALSGSNLYATGDMYDEDFGYNIIAVQVGVDGTLNWSHHWQAAYHEDYGMVAGVGSTGDMYICGYVAHAYGTWQPLGLTESPLVGVSVDAAPAATGITGTAKELNGVPGTPSGQHDTGGGLDDGVIMRWNFEE